MHVYGINPGPNDFIVRGMKTIQNYTRQNNVNDTGQEKQGFLVFQRAEK